MMLGSGRTGDGADSDMLAVDYWLCASLLHAIAASKMGGNPAAAAARAVKKQPNTGKHQPSNTSMQHAIHMSQLHVLTVSRIALLANQLSPR